MARGAIYVGWRWRPDIIGRKRCKACGRLTDGNCFVIRDDDSYYVCNVHCGLKVIADDSEPLILNPNKLDIIGLPQKMPRC